jgi:hypothetical protein
MLDMGKRGSEGRASLALRMPALAKILLKRMRGRLLAVVTTVRGADGDLACARCILAFFFLWHMDGMAYRNFAGGAEGRDAREYPSCEYYQIGGQ